MTEVEKRLYRLPKEGVIAGVAAGFADYFSMDVTLMRVIFIILAFATGGAAVIGYIIMAIVMPIPDKKDTKNVDIGQRIEGIVQEVKDNGRAERIANYFGAGLVIIGVWLLMAQLLPKWFALRWDLVWPILIVLFGIWMITRSKNNEREV